MQDVNHREKDVHMRRIKIFVDAQVWRHWFTLKAGEAIENPQLEKYAKDFDKICNVIASRPEEFLFLYNTRIEQELPEKHRKGLPVCFETVKSSGLLEHIPIPLTKSDGTYKADGRTTLGGGHFGGRLRGLLNLDGKDHEKRIREARPAFDKANPAHTKPRRDEFDIEHLESALEAGADFFITSDHKTILDNLEKAFKTYPTDPAILRANEICMTPSAALAKILKS